MYTQNMKLLEYIIFDQDLIVWMIMNSGAAWCILGLKAKIDYLILVAKLLLINMNYVEFFLFF